MLEWYVFFGRIIMYYKPICKLNHVSTSKLTYKSLKMRKDTPMEIDLKVTT